MLHCRWWSISKSERAVKSGKTRFYIGSKYDIIRALLTETIHSYLTK